MTWIVLQSENFGRKKVFTSTLTCAHFLAHGQWALLDDHCIALNGSQRTRQTFYVTDGIIKYLSTHGWKIILYKMKQKNISIYVSTVVVGDTACCLSLLFALYPSRLLTVGARLPWFQAISNTSRRSNFGLEILMWPQAYITLFLAGIHATRLIAVPLSCNSPHSCFRHISFIRALIYLHVYDMFVCAPASFLRWNLLFAALFLEFDMCVCVLYFYLMGIQSKSAN